MKVLVVVDMQNDFIDGALGTPEAQVIVPKVVEKLEHTDRSETLVIFTKDTHYEDYMDTLEGKLLRFRTVLQIRMDGVSIRIFPE